MLNRLRWVRPCEPRQQIPCELTHINVLGLFIQHDSKDAVVMRQRDIQIGIAGFL